MGDLIDPAPLGQGWVDIRLIGEPHDVEKWADQIHTTTDVWSDSENKPIRSQPWRVRRYIRTRLRKEET